MNGPRPDDADAAIRTPPSGSGPDPPISDSPSAHGPLRNLLQPAPVRDRGPVDVPDHTLSRIIGRGAYGEVWLARSTLGTLRAVKVVRREDFADSRPFDREFRGIQKYEPVSRSHEGLIDILQVGRNDAQGYFYYVMELADPGTVPGAAKSSLQPAATSGPPSGTSEAGSVPPDYTPRTLRHELQTRGRLPGAQCLEIARALAGALEHLHAQGLVHRDVKPSNIVFVGGRPKLADIGLVTNTGDARSVVGTDGYLPPEGAGTPGADVYSLGKVIYEMGTGLDRRRFPELPCHVEPPAEVAALRELNEIILRACAWDPARRYASTTALRRDLERLREGRSVRSRRVWETTVGRLRPVMLTAAFLVLVGLAWLRPAPWRKPVIEAPAPLPERASIFVLPFRIADGESAPALAYWPWRMTDAIIDALASLEGVRRSPRRRGWMGRPEGELRQSLARTNDFRHVLSGELLQRDAAAVLRLRLDEREGMLPVWRREFIGRTNDMVGLEREALADLQRFLGIEARPAEAERIESTLLRNEEVRRRLVACGDLVERDLLVYASYTRIIELTEEALVWEPGCLDARFMRMSAMRDLALFTRPPSEIFPEMVREMTQILAVDDTDPAALNFMSLPTLLRGWDWVGHDAWVQRELLWETGSGAHMVRALWLRIHGELDQARSEQAKAESLGIQDTTQAFFAMSSRWVHRDYDDGIGFGEREVRKAPDRIWPHYFLAHLYVEKGDYTAAFRAIDRVEQVNPVPALAALRAYAFARMGNPARAREILEDLLGARLRPHYLQPYFVARVHAALGDREAAIDWLLKAEEERSEFLTFADWGGLRTDPVWDGFLDHPRFQSLLKVVGLDQWPVPIRPLPQVPSAVDGIERIRPARR